MKGKLYSFEQFFTAEDIPMNKEKMVKIDRIVVPKIQRPYAQGRKQERFIRQTFLKDIFDAISRDEILEMNFVYGIVRQSEDKLSIFELLDGQQRITTLFLLHWYLANRMLDTIPEYLSRFVYETRTTSTDFCQELSKFKKEIRITPSKTIKQAKWYARSFDKDATIEAMLIMLDAIHEKCEETVVAYPTIKLFPRLVNLKFYILSLGEFGLSEELYIQMNARGLSLTPFDNFKADLVGYIKDSPTLKEPVLLVNSQVEKEVPLYLNISTKIDTTWIDLFWHKGSTDYDKIYFSFFHRYFANKCLLEYRKNLSPDNMRTSQTYAFLDDLSQKEQSRYLGFGVFKAMLDADIEHIKHLEVVLDCLKEHYVSDIRPLLFPAWSAKEWGLFEDSSKFTREQAVVFGAVVEFIEAYESFDKTLFKQWMRVVWNVVENTNIDGLSPQTATLRKLAEIIRAAAKARDLYGVLSSYAVGDDNSRAIKEEGLKAVAILAQPKWEEVFTTAEIHSFLKGMVGFFYTPDMTIVDFEHRYELVKDVFCDTGIVPALKKRYLLIRAMLCQLKEWKELSGLNITSNVEPEKYLKNLLASNHNVRQFFRALFSLEDLSAVRKELEAVVASPATINIWDKGTDVDQECLNRAYQRLCTDVRLHQWMEKERAIRVQWSDGHTFVSRPKAWYARVMLDTERNVAIASLVENDDFRYFDENQVGMYKEVGDYYGKSVDLVKNISGREIWLQFDIQRTINVWVAFSDNADKQSLLLKYQIRDEVIGKGYYLLIGNYNYAGTDIYQAICRLLFDPSMGCLSRLS